MDYAKAKALIEEDAPNLFLDPEVEGQPHVIVRISEGATPFCITLPKSTEDNPQTDEELTDTMRSSIRAAKQHLGA